jgi:hypothetical protein
MRNFHYLEITNGFYLNIQRPVARTRIEVLRMMPTEIRFSQTQLTVDGRTESPKVTRSVLFFRCYVF